MYGIDPRIWSGEQWQAFALTVGGVVLPGDKFNAPKIVVQQRGWYVTVDVAVFNTVRLTRIVAPFINKDGFTFSLKNKPFVVKLIEIFGTQGLETGIPTLDKSFLIQSNTPKKALHLFKQLRWPEPLFPADMSTGPAGKGDFRITPQAQAEEVCELRYSSQGVITKVRPLRDRLILVLDTLDTLASLGSAYGI